MTREDLEAKVLEFINGQVRPPKPDKITVASQLERDLRMIWEDIEDLLVKFFDMFKVNHAGFDFMRYVSAPRPWLQRRTPRPPVKPLTIRMLVDAAEHGRWVDDPDAV